MEEVGRKIDRLVAELKTLPKISEENQRKLDSKFRLEFNYNSNHLEGNTLTYGETKLLLMFDKTEGVHDLREFEEMKAHDVAYKLVQAWAKGGSEAPLTESDIKELNQVILVRSFWKGAETLDGQSTRRQIRVGAYKEFPNSVRLQNGEMFYYASPMDTPIRMWELMEWFREEERKGELHPLALAALLHYKFVLIHPFDDGNGRISRLLMNYVLLKHGFPPVVIKTADKKGYLNALNQADSGNLDAFVGYIGEHLVWSLGVVLKATRGESVEDSADGDKEIALLLKHHRHLKNVSEEATGKIIAETLLRNIFPLFKMIDENLSPLLELFYDKLEKMEYNYPEDISYKHIDLNEIGWEKIKTNWVLGQLKEGNIKIQHLKYNYTLNGFKKSLSNLRYSVQIEIWFKDFSYLIENKFISNSVREFGYGHEIDKEVLFSIVKPLVREVIERIKHDVG